MKRHVLGMGAVAAIAAAPWSGSWAADNCTGTYTHVVVSAETEKLGDDMSITSFVNRGTSLSADSAYSGAGTCAGYMLVLPDGKRTVAGACGRVNKDGDRWSFTWAYDASGTGGTWQMAGGTGMYAGKKSSGWFKREMRDGKVSTGNWGGTCE